MCPDLNTLVQIEDGTLEGPDSDALEAHILICASCSETLLRLRWVREQVLETVSQSPHSPLPVQKEPAVRAIPEKGMSSFSTVLRKCTYPLFRNKASIAASLLLAAGLTVFAAAGFLQNAGDSSSGLSRSMPRIEEGRLYQADQPLSLASGHSGELHLSAGTELQALSHGEGNRTRLRLTKGELFARARDASSQFDIEVPGGSVRDIGTEFFIRVRETSLPWNPSAKYRITSVETREGIVEVAGEGRKVRSDPTKTVYLIDGKDLFLKSAESSSIAPRWDALFRSLENALGQKDELGALRAWAVLLEKTGRDREGLLEYARKKSTPPGRLEWSVSLGRATGEKSLIQKLEILVQKREE